jgi:hypothetical protein
LKKKQKETVTARTDLQSFLAARLQSSVNEHVFKLLVDINPVKSQLCLHQFTLCHSKEGFTLHWVTRVTAVCHQMGDGYMI